MTGRQSSFASELAFDCDADRHAFQAELRRLVVRAVGAEDAARGRLKALGVRERAYRPGRRDAPGAFLPARRRADPACDGLASRRPSTGGPRP